MFAKNYDMTDTEAMLGELDRIVSEELKKKDSERDDTLIDECIEEMAKLKNVRAGYSQEEIAVKFEEIQTKAAGTSKKPPVRRKSIRRSVAAVCAACLVLVCGVATVAWNPFYVMRDWFYELLEAPNGTITETGITYTNQGKIVKYDSVEELLNSEKLNIYYPSVLPDNVYITRIDLLNPGIFDCINIYFNDPTIQFTIQLDTPAYLNTSEYEIIQLNDITYYITYQNNKYCSRAYINSNLYLIECINYQDIIFIINNLKKG